MYRKYTATFFINNKKLKIKMNISNIRIGTKQPTQLRSDQNFIAMFGFAGWRTLKQIFDPCCAVLQHTTYPTKLDMESATLCALPFPVIYVPEGGGSEQFDDLAELIAYFQDQVTDSVVVTDGCSLIVYHAPDNPPTFTDNRFLNFDTVYGYGAGIGFNNI